MTVSKSAEIVIYVEGHQEILRMLRILGGYMRTLKDIIIL